MRGRDISADRRVADIIRRAIREDAGRGDITSQALVPSGAKAKAVILSRGNYVVCGTGIARKVFMLVDRSLKCTVCRGDGKRVGRGQAVMRISGNARSILMAERTALNFIQRMTGIATLTSAFVAKVKPYGCTILDTRKTTPNLRVLEKYAVLCGGGQNHRMGLYDRVLIKDNHRRLWTGRGSRGLDTAVMAARRRFPTVEIEIEVENSVELKSALRARPDWVLLDNMSAAGLKECVKLCQGRSRLEASGGITLRNVRTIAASGVDAISLGCLTHSAPAADLSLELG